MSELGKPRPIEAQTWRAHHTGRVNYGGTPSPTSGCQKRRRKAILRRAWVEEMMLRHQYRQRVMLGAPDADGEA